MKTYKNLSYILLLVLGALVFTNCSDKDDDKRVVNIAVYKDQLVSGTGSKKVIRIKDNETRQLNIHIMPTDAANKNLAFRLKESGVASVSSDGLLSPISIGTDTLVIEALDGSGAFVEYGIDVIDHMIPITSLVLPSSAQKVSIGKGQEYNLGSKVQISPSDAWNKNLTYVSSDESILTVDDKGIVTGLELGTATVTIRSTDGSDKETVSEITVTDKISKYYELADMKDWTVQASYTLPSEGGKNSAQSIIDGDFTDNNFFLSMVKPGGTMEGIAVGANEDVSVIINMKKVHEVDFLRYHHRHNLTRLRFLAITISGSNDGVSFTKVAENVEIPRATEGGNDTKDSGIIDIPSSKYSYYKVSFTGFEPDDLPGQLTEIQFGYTILAQ